jgi:hypothetical protein
MQASFHIRIIIAYTFGQKADEARITSPHFMSLIQTWLQVTFKRDKHHHMPHNCTQMEAILTVMYEAGRLNYEEFNDMGKGPLCMHDASLLHNADNDASLNISNALMRVCFVPHPFHFLSRYIHLNRL